MNLRLVLSLPPWHQSMIGLGGSMASGCPMHSTMVLNQIKNMVIQINVPLCWRLHDTASTSTLYFVLGGVTDNLWQMVYMCPSLLSLLTGPHSFYYYWLSPQRLHIFIKYNYMIYWYTVSGGCIGANLKQITLYLEGSGWNSYWNPDPDSTQELKLIKLTCCYQCV